MAIAILSVDEGQPSAWPSVPGHDGKDLDAIWQRIEAWIAHRWAARSVVYIAEGNGPWKSRLQPFTLTTVELWTDADTFEPVTLRATATGGLMLAHETYRITGTAGDDATPPPAVLEAASRLADYLAADNSGLPQAGASRSKIGVGGSIDIEAQRSPTWMAKALAYSGAADLLRPYRRLGE